MKPLLLPLLGAFAAGIGATLAFQALTQPHVPQASAPQITPAQPPATSPVPIGKTPAPAAPTTILTAATGDTSPSKKSATTAKPDEKRKAQRAQWKKQWQEQTRKRTEEENRIRLDYLAEELGLSPDQVARMKTALAKTLDERFASTKAGSSEVIFNSDDPMESTLAQVMSPEQKIAHAALKEKERAHNIEARTMQRFATLPETLNLSEQQRDQVYDLIAREEAEAPGTQTPVLGGLTLSASGANVLTNSFTLNIGRPMTSTFVETSPGTPDATPGDTITVMREDAQQRIEERVDAMRPILNERQLEAYRSHINKAGGLIRTDGASIMEVQVLAE